MASPQSFYFVGGRGAYLVNWFGIWNGVSFISLVSWVGVGDITGCSVPRGQSGVVEVPLLLWFRFLTFFLPVYFFKIYDSFIIPPTHPKQPHPRILFFWEVLRAPNHPTLFTYFLPHSFCVLITVFCT